MSRADAFGVGWARGTANETVLLVAAPATALFLFWAIKNGALADTVWLPSGLFLLMLLLVVGVSVRPQLPPAAATAAAGLAAYAGLETVSISWSVAPGLAWEGANRTLLYLLVFILFAALPWTPETVALMLASFAVGAAAIGAFELVRVAGDPATYREYFRGARFSAPLGYPNATCALMLMASFPAALMASQRGRPPIVRGVLLATAGASAELALMSQSRASVVAVPTVALFVFALTPGRMRIALALVTVAAAVACAAPAILGVYSRVIAGDPASALLFARRALLLSTAALFVLGAAWGTVDTRFEVPPRATHALGRIVSAALLALALAGAGIALSARPLARGGEWWHEFKSNSQANEQTPHLVAGIGSNRYDIWRVAFDEFRRAPVLGVGSDNFAADYLRYGRTSEQPLYPHSLELRIISQTGLVGAVLFGSFLAVALRAVWRGLQRGSEATRLTMVAAGSLFLYWLVHGSIDWFWEIPALTGPALAFLASVVRLGSSPAAIHAARPRRWHLGIALLCGASVATAVSFALPWAASKQVAIAAADWNADPTAALRRLDLARKLNPLSDAADTAAGVIAARSGDMRRERRAFQRALQRNPTNWYAHLELSLLDAAEGRRGEALAAIRRARVLNPRDAVLDLVQHRIARGERVSQATVERLFLARSALLTGVRQN